MARPDSQLPLLPSILDRLIDREPDVSTEPAWRQAQSLREFEISVLRDLEALLNTRQTRPDLADGSLEISQSVLTYGLPEFSSVGVGSAAERERLRVAVERCITRFEPRLREVHVTIRDPENEYDRALRMTIEGLLWVQPNPHAITFDTVLKPSQGQCTVTSRSH